MYICVYNVYNGNNWSFPYKKQSQISNHSLPNSDFQVIIPFLLHSTISFLSNGMRNGDWEWGSGKERRWANQTLFLLKRVAKVTLFLQMKTHRMPTYLQQTFSWWVRTDTLLQQAQCHIQKGCFLHLWTAQPVGRVCLDLQITEILPIKNPPLQKKYLSLQKSIYPYKIQKLTYKIELIRK